MSDDDGHEDGTADHGGHEEGVEPSPAYDPADKDLPSREPPLRGTAPQSPYTMRDVGLGFVVLLVGVAIAFGLPLALL